MTQRLDYKNASPKGFAAMLALELHARASGLEHGLLELVKTRVSQLNGCAFCLDMHARAAKKLGESDERMLLLSAWREAGLFDARERAALAWTEAVTRIADAHIPDTLYEATRQHFSEQEIVDLTWAITVINGWNRMMAAFAVPPMTKPAAERAAE